MSRRIDVLFAGEALLPQLGGAERFALELLGYLASRGHRARALVAGVEDWVERWRVHAPTVEVVAIGARQPDDPAAGSWQQRAARAEEVSAAIRQTCRSDGPDIVIGQLYAGAGAVSGARAAGVPGALLLAGYEALCHWAFAPGSDCLPATRCRDCPRSLALRPDERGAQLDVRAAQDRAVESADVLVAPSDAMAGACEALLGRRPHVVPPVVRGPRRADARVSGDVVLVSSVWSPGKGAGLLADIAHRLPHRRIRVHGPNGVPEPQRSALSALPHVELSEGASEIDALLDGAGALLVPSQHAEPFGRVAFEGLAAGVPTLTSDVGGLKEYVPHAQRVAAYADPAAWATAVRRLEAPEAWARTSRDGLRAAAEVLARRGPERLEQLLVEAVELGDVPAGRGS